MPVTVFEPSKLASVLYAFSTDFSLLCKKANLDNVQYGGRSPLGPTGTGRSYTVYMTRAHRYQVQTGNQVLPGTMPATAIRRP